MAQVKFYSVTDMSSVSTVDEGGIYFVKGGELYKGAQRFGLGRVTVAKTTAGIADMKRGDIVVTGGGAGWVYAGSEAGQGWQPLGGDTTSLQGSWRADISTWISGLNQSFEGSYITGITKEADGKVTARASNFE